MNNERLDYLFQEIREEKVETSINEVNKWIALSAASVGLFGLLSHFKLSILLTKKIIIMTSIALSIGIGATALLLSMNHESPKNELLDSKTGVSLVKEHQQDPIVTKDNLDFVAKREPVSKGEVQNAKLHFTAEEPINDLEIKKLEGFELNLESKEPVVKAGTEINVVNFNQVHVSGAYQVFISLGDKVSVLAEGDDADIEKIEAKVNRGELHIKQKPNTKSKSGKVTIHITMTELTGVGVSGASSIKSTMILDIPELDVQGTGAGNIDLQLKCNKLTIEGTGASNINLSGTTKTINAQVTGACNLDCLELSAEEVDIVSTGSANTECQVNIKLNVNASGASHVKYTGEATRIEISENGSAQIRKKG